MSEERDPVAQVATAPTRPRTVNALRNTVRTPVFPARLPKTVPECMIEYMHSKLAEWENAKMRGWEQRVKQAYGRRKYLQGVIKARACRLHAGTMEQRMGRAADTMEGERCAQGLSLARYIEYLKRHDPNVKKRKRGESEPS